MLIEPVVRWGKPWSCPARCASIRPRMVVCEAHPALVFGLDAKHPGTGQSHLSVALCRRRRTERWSAGSCSPEEAGGGGGGACRRGVGGMGVGSGTACCTAADVLPCPLFGACTMHRSVPGTAGGIQSVCKTYAAATSVCGFSCRPGVCRRSCRNGQSARVASHCVELHWLRRFLQRREFHLSGQINDRRVVMS